AHRGSPHRGRPPSRMIDGVLELARRRVDQGDGADALERRVECTSVTFEWGRLKGAGVVEEAGVNLRVLHRGRVGIAGATNVGVGDVGAPQAVPLLDRALASAELGEEIALAFPAAAQLPRVTTHVQRTADASLARLIEIGQFLLDRLTREGCQVNVAIEREVAETWVANTAGAAGSYRSTGVAVSADVWRIAGDDVLAIGDAIESTDIPAEDALEGVVRSITHRLDHALRIVAPPRVRCRWCSPPRACRPCCSRSRKGSRARP